MGFILKTSVYDAETLCVRKHIELYKEVPQSLGGLILIN